MPLDGSVDRARLRRRDVLKTAGAAAGLSAVPIIGRAAEPTVIIGALYPVTGSLAQIGQGCVVAAKLAAAMEGH